MTTEEHLALHDKQIAAIRALVKEGMQMVIATRKDIRALMAIQKKTSEDLRILVNSLKRGSNGHGKKRIDLQ